MGYEKGVGTLREYLELVVTFALSATSVDSQETFSFLYIFVDCIILLDLPRLDQFPACGGNDGEG